jgi:glucose-1-phosphate thymidylyltransferase
LIHANPLRYRPAVTSTPPSCTRAVILARGLGTRMRRPSPGPDLDPRQASVADTGVKAMIPIGRPFLDYLLTAVADAGCREACLVIGPEHDAIRKYYTEQVPISRLSIRFAIQDRPLGTANAVLAAEACAGGKPFLALNSDNFYPVRVLERMCQLDGPGLAGFEREALVREGNIDQSRVAKYAVLEVDRAGHLRRIVEKPDEAAWDRIGRDAPISMNCWRFGPAIFEAARAIGLSPRGEYELADAVQHAIDVLGEQFEVVPAREGVLDLSMRGDIPSVARRLAGFEVRL